VNLAIVETPLQLINAIEARHHFAQETHLLILVGHFGVESFEPLLDRRDWRSVRFFRIFDRAQLLKKKPEMLRTLRQLWLRVRFDRFLQSYGSVDALMLGNYLENHKNYMRHAHHVVPHHRIVLLDDGTDTILVARELTDRAGTRQPLPAAGQRSALGQFRGALRERFVDWRSHQADELTLLTVFDVTARPSDRVIRHEYEHLRSSLGAAAQLDRAVFLGQCLVEDGYLDLPGYLSQLAQAFERLGPLEIIYVPHPREESATTEAVRTQFKVAIERPKLPIECHIAASGQVPRKLASFFCSALVNCSIIFGDLMDVVSFRLDDAIVIRHHETMWSIYKYLDEMGSRVKLVALAAENGSSIVRQSRAASGMVASVDT
jgi:hypothetical protein